ncbi:Insulin-like growth factor-binding protein complex acid labile subunit [Anthophora quadrimaculata]
MEYAWTFMSVLFFSAQLVFADYEYGRKFTRLHPQSQSDKHWTIFTATVQPPKRPSYREPKWNNYTPSPTATYLTRLPYKDIEEFTVRTTCTDYKKQIEKLRVGMESNTILDLSSIGAQKLGHLFIHSPHVKTLYLNDNNITEISTTAFQGLPNLEVLTLSNNKIPTDKLLYLKEHETLKTLLLDDNNGSNSNLDQMFDNMPRLTELSLKRDGIKNFTVNLKEFAPSLTKLYLSGNKIQSTDFLNNVPEKLSHLYLDNNNIDTLTGYKLDNVQELFVNENKIKQVGSKEEDNDERRLTLDGMTKLVKLNVSSNEISNVAQNAFTDTKNLIELDLSNNKIAELLNDIFKGLSLLETLRISKNQLIFIPNLCWSNRLKSLDLSDNHIVAVTRESFCNNQFTDTNELFNTNKDSFRKLSMLQWLDLSGNRIVNFPVDLIHEPTYLKVLLLKDNNIASINDLFNVRSNTLKELHLEGNPLLFITVNFMPNLKIHLMKCKETIELENTTVSTTTSKKTDGYWR